MRLAFALSAVVAIGASCSGCSPECQGEQRPAGCPCQSDQDCTTKAGEVLLCTEGTCTAGNPPDAPGTRCTSDAQCTAGAACGVDGVCVPAPKCQRIDGAAAPLSFLAAPGAGTGPLTSAARADCTHTWAAQSGGATLNASVTIGLDGVITVSDQGSAPPCTGGTWHTSARFGEIDCGATIWFIGPEDALAAACNLGAGTCP